jgi:hypothetical protein
MNSIRNQARTIADGWERFQAVCPCGLAVSAPVNLPPVQAALPTENRRSGWRR